MKIVNRETFLKMPKNTVFTKYEPCNFGDLMIKGETLYPDFFQQQVLQVDCNDSVEFIDILEAARKEGKSFNLDLDCEGRDGLFDEDQLFAVFEKADVEMLIGRLKRCVKGEWK